MHITILPPDLIRIDDVVVRVDKRDFPAAPAGYEPLQFELIMWNPGNAQRGIRPSGVMHITSAVASRKYEERIFHDPAILMPYVRAFMNALALKAARQADEEQSGHDQSKVA